MEQTGNDLRTGLIQNNGPAYSNLAYDIQYNGSGSPLDQPREGKEYRYVSLDSTNPERVDSEISFNTTIDENKPLNQNYQAPNGNGYPTNNRPETTAVRPPTDATFLNQNQAPNQIRHPAPENTMPIQVQCSREDMEMSYCNFCKSKVLIPKVATLFKCAFCQKVSDKRVPQQQQIAPVQPQSQPQPQFRPVSVPQQQFQPQMQPQFQPQMQPQFQPYPQFQQQQQLQPQPQIQQIRVLAQPKPQAQPQPQPQFQPVMQQPYPIQTMPQQQPQVQPNANATATSKYFRCGTCKTIIRYEPVSKYVRCVCNTVNFIP